MTKLSYLVCVLVLLCCVAGCRDSGSAFSDGPLPQPDAGACSPTSPRAQPVVMGVFPDDGEAPYVEVIQSATSTIRVYAYLFGYGGMLDALKLQASLGLDVRVLVDREQDVNNTYLSQLTAVGAKVVKSDPQFTHMHAKVIIADEAMAAISTGNYSTSQSVERNRDYVARVTDADDLADLISLFDADWNGTPPSLPCTRLLVSPINAKLRMEAFINSATTSLEIESMQFAETNIRDAVAARKKAGVDVRVILAEASWVNTNTEAAYFLKSNGIEVRYMKDPGVHAKAVVVDGAQAYVGSINLSYTSINKNREVGVIALDPTAVQRVRTTFEKDWNLSTSF